MDVRGYSLVVAGVPVKIPNQTLSNDTIGRFEPRTGAFLALLAGGFVGVSSEGSAIFVRFCPMLLMGVEWFCSQFCSHCMMVFWWNRVPFVTE